MRLSGLVCLLICQFFVAGCVLPKGRNVNLATNSSSFSWERGAIIRGYTDKKQMALVFTGHEFGEGTGFILQTLQNQNVKASFFFTGEFYKNPQFENDIRQLLQHGHYLGAHSDQHLLYCDWTNRDSLLVTRDQFVADLEKNYDRMKRFGISKAQASFFLPPYEWYNDSIADWTKTLGLQLVNYTKGTLSHADYTTPADKNYRNSDTIYQSILLYEQKQPAGLNGFILLMHTGTDSKRTDKFYRFLPQLIEWLKLNRYQLVRIDELLKS